ncbi:MAG: radical SAM protein [Bacteroidales bacterium]|nr:radical SAM protein [Bacteroidales bacterium]
MSEKESKTKRLLLINPRNQMIKKGIEFNLHTVYESLGLAIVAALTPSHWQVEILDENLDLVTFREADLVGLTSFTSNANRAYEIARIFRTRGVPVVMGGIHASMIPEDAVPYVDTMFTGEAEGAWPEVIADFEAGKLKKRYEGGLPDLDAIPRPRHDLSHSMLIYASVQTTRGCPMDCNFCTVSAFNGTRYRLRPVKEILDELESIPKRRIFFVDDNIIGHNKLTREHARELFRGMIDRKLNKEWFSQASMNIADDPELVKLAAQSGCKMLLLGIESEKVENLQEIHKMANLKLGVKQYRSVFRCLHRYGIVVLGAFIFGLESDTVDDLYRRKSYINRSGVDAIQATILTPYPGTRLFEKMVGADRLIKKDFPEDWQHYNMFVTTFRPNKMSPEALSAAMKNIWKKLYNRNSLRIRLIRTFLNCWHPNPVRWAKKGLNAALWGFYTNHLTYRQTVEQYYAEE